MGLQLLLKLYVAMLHTALFFDTFLVSHPLLPSESLFTQSKTFDEAGIARFVKKRQNALNYLKRCVQGKGYWLNIVKLNETEINTYYESENMRRR